jgi:hypothetical protein
MTSQTRDEGEDMRTTIMAAIAIICCTGVAFGQGAGRGGAGQAGEGGGTVILEQAPST